MKNSLFLILCLIFLLPIQSVFSQPQSKIEILEIRVIDSEEQVRINGAKVMLEISNEDYYREKITNMKGSTKFKNVPLGKARILTIKKGYETSSEIINIENAKTFKIIIKLEKSHETGSD